ncbi:MAG: hypothetical protein WDW38_006061 [Sanguina aurantia]
MAPPWVPSPVDSEGPDPNSDPAFPDSADLDNEEDAALRIDHLFTVPLPATSLGQPRVPSLSHMPQPPASASASIQQQRGALGSGAPGSTATPAAAAAAAAAAGGRRHARSSGYGRPAATTDALPPHLKGGGRSGGAWEAKISTSHYDVTRSRLFYGCQNGDVCFWPLSTSGAGTSRYLGSHVGPVTCIVAPRPGDGDLGTAGLVLTSGQDGCMKVWDYQGRVVLAPAVLVQTLYGHSGSVTSVVASGGYLVSGGTDHTVRVWRAVAGRGALLYPWFELQSTVATLNGWVRGMSLDRSREAGDCGRVYAVDDGGDVIGIALEGVYDTAIGRYASSCWGVPPPGGGPPVAIVRQHDCGVRAIRYVAAWNLLVTLCYDQCLRVYDASGGGGSSGGSSSGGGGEGGEMRHCWENEHRCQFTDVEVCVETNEILAADSSGCLSIFSLSRGRLVATSRLTPERGPIISFSSVLSRQLYAVVVERRLTVVRVEHQLDYNTARGGHEGAVVGMYSCSGGLGADAGDRDFRLFTASEDNSVRVWDPAGMDVIRVLHESVSEITAMTFHEGWNLVVTGHDNGAIRVWSLDTGRATTLLQHTNSITFLGMALVHRNEELLVSAGYDGQVVLWDIRGLRGEALHMVSKFRAHGVTTAAESGGGGGSSMFHVQALATASAPRPDPNSILHLDPNPNSNPNLTGSAQDPADCPSPRTTIITPTPPPPPTPPPRAAAPHGGSGSGGGSRPARSSGGVDGDVPVQVGGVSRSGSNSGGGGGAGRGRVGSGGSSRDANSKGRVSGAAAAAAAASPGGAALGGVEASAGGGRASGNLAAVGATRGGLGGVGGRQSVSHAHVGAVSGGGGGSMSGVPVSGGGGGGGGGVPAKAAAAKSVSLQPPRAESAAAVLAAQFGLEPEILAVKYDPSKKVIITAGNDRVIKVWAVAGFTLLARHVGHTDAVGALALDGNFLFSGSEDATIRVWDTVPARVGSGDPASASSRHLLPSSASLRVLHGHTRCVTGLEVLPRTGHLLSCSLDGSLRRWDYVTGEVLHIHQHVSEEFRCLALRWDKAEVFVGTQQANVLRYTSGLSSTAKNPAPHIAAAAAAASAAAAAVATAVAAAAAAAAAASAQHASAVAQHPSVAASASQSSTLVGGQQRLTQSPSTRPAGVTP